MRTQSKTSQNVIQQPHLSNQSNNARKIIPIKQKEKSLKRVVSTQKSRNRSSQLTNLSFDINRSSYDRCNNLTQNDDNLQNERNKIAKNISAIVENNSFQIQQHQSNIVHDFLRKKQLSPSVNDRFLEFVNQEYQNKQFEEFVANCYKKFSMIINDKPFKSQQNKNKKRSNSHHSQRYQNLRTQTLTNALSQFDSNMNTVQDNPSRSPNPFYNQKYKKFCGNQGIKRPSSAVINNKSNIIPFSNRGRKAYDSRQRNDRPLLTPVMNRPLTIRNDQHSLGNSNGSPKPQEHVFAQTMKLKFLQRQRQQIQNQQENQDIIINEYTDQRIDEVIQNQDSREMSLPVSRYVTDDMNIVPAENVQSISQAQRSVRVLSVNEIGLNILNQDSINSNIENNQIQETQREQQDVSVRISIQDQDNNNEQEEIIISIDNQMIEEEIIVEIDQINPVMEYICFNQSDKKEKIYTQFIIKEKMGTQPSIQKNEIDKQSEGQIRNNSLVNPNSSNQFERNLNDDVKTLRPVDVQIKNQFIQTGQIQIEPEDTENKYQPSIISSISLKSESIDNIMTQQKSVQIVKKDKPRLTEKQIAINEAEAQINEHFVSNFIQQADESQKNTTKSCLLKKKNFSKYIESINQEFQNHKESSLSLASQDFKIKTNDFHQSKIKNKSILQILENKQTKSVIFDIQQNKFDQHCKEVVIKTNENTIAKLFSNNVKKKMRYALNIFKRQQLLHQYSYKRKNRLFPKLVIKSLISSDDLNFDRIIETSINQQIILESFNQNQVKQKMDCKHENENNHLNILVCHFAELPYLQRRYDFQAAEDHFFKQIQKNKKLKMKKSFVYSGNMMEKLSQSLVSRVLQNQIQNKLDNFYSKNQDLIKNHIENVLDESIEKYMSHIDFVEVVDPTSIENFTNPVEVFNQKRPLHHFKTYYSDHDAIIRIKKVPRDYNLDRLFNKCNQYGKITFFDIQKTRNIEYQDVIVQYLYKEQALNLFNTINKVESLNPYKKIIKLLAGKTRQNLFSNNDSNSDSEGNNGLNNNEFSNFECSLVNSKDLIFWQIKLDWLYSDLDVSSLFERTQKEQQESNFCNYSLRQINKLTKDFEKSKDEMNILYKEKMNGLRLKLQKIERDIKPQKNIRHINVCLLYSTQTIDQLSIDLADRLFQHCYQKFKESKFEIFRDKYCTKNHQQHIITHIDKFRDKIKFDRSYQSINQDKINIGKIILGDCSPSIYLIMYQKSQNFVLYNKIKSFYDKANEEKNFCKDKIKDLTKKDIFFNDLKRVKRYQSLKSFQISTKHNQIKHHLFMKNLEENSNLMNDYDGQSENILQNLQHNDRELVRCDALDNFDKYCVQQMISQAVNPKMHKFKDELSFFYKKIEVPINMQDEYLNKLMINFFGYKCQIQRDPKHPEKFYELYVPILREKGNEKLIKREEQQNKNQIKNVNALIQQNQDKRLKYSKVAMSYVRPPDLETDQSMNDIDWRDIKGLEEYNSMAEERAKRLMRKGISKRNTTDRKQSIQATQQFILENSLKQRVQERRTSVQFEQLFQKVKLNKIITNTITPLEYYTQKQQFSSNTSKYLEDQLMNSKSIRFRNKTQLQMERNSNDIQLVKIQKKVHSIINEQQIDVHRDEVIKFHDIDQELQFYRKIQAVSHDCIQKRNILDYGKDLEIPEIYKNDIKVVKLPEISPQKRKFFQEKWKNQISMRQKLNEDFMNMKIDYRPLDEIITLVNGKKITLGYDFQSEIIEDTSNSRMKDKSKNFTEMTAKIKNREKLSKESGGFEINDFQQDVSIDGGSPDLRKITTVPQISFGLFEEKKELNSNQNKQRLRRSNSIQQELTASALQFNYEISHDLKQLDELFKQIDPCREYIKNEMMKQLNKIKNQRFGLIKSIPESYIDLELNDLTSQPILNQEHELNLLKLKSMMKDIQKSKQQRLSRLLLILKNKTQKPIAKKNLQQSVRQSNELHTNKHKKHVMHERLMILQKEYKFDLGGNELRRKSSMKNKELASLTFSPNTSQSESIDINQPNDIIQLEREREQMLIDAVQQGNTKRIAMIIERYHFKFHKINDIRGNNLIGIAAKFGHYDAVKFLLDQFIDPNHQNNDGNTPLHYSVEGHYKNITNLLFNYGADDKIQNNLKQTCWELTIE